jgi:hypothetical protein
MTCDMLPDHSNHDPDGMQQKFKQGEGHAEQLERAVEEAKLSMEQQQAAVDAELKRLQGKLDAASDQAQVRCACDTLHTCPRARNA